MLKARIFPQKARWLDFRMVDMPVNGIAVSPDDPEVQQEKRKPRRPRQGEGVVEAGKVPQVVLDVEYVDLHGKIRQGENGKP